MQKARVGSRAHLRGGAPDGAQRLPSRGSRWPTKASRRPQFPPQAEAQLRLRDEARHRRGRHAFASAGRRQRLYARTDGAHLSRPARRCGHINFSDAHASAQAFHAGGEANPNAVNGVAPRGHDESCPRGRARIPRAAVCLRQRISTFGARSLPHGGDRVTRVTAMPLEDYSRWPRTWGWSASVFVQPSAYARQPPMLDAMRAIGAGALPRNCGRRRERAGREPMRCTRWVCAARASTFAGQPRADGIRYHPSSIRRLTHARPNAAGNRLPSAGLAHLLADRRTGRAEGAVHAGAHGHVPWRGEGPAQPGFVALIELSPCAASVPHVKHPLAPTAWLAPDFAGCRADGAR